MRLVAALVAVATLGALARGQETVFNVPSPDVLEKGRVYLETDQYVGDDEGLGLLRGVYGLTPDVEVGVNTGPFDYRHSSAVFVDGTVKWRPFASSSGGFFLGDHLGVNVHGDPAHDARDYAYAAGYVVLSRAGTRISAGPYYATEDYFAPEARWGAQLTLEQPIAAVDGLTAAADWYSGSGAAATTGLVWARSPWTFYLGYGFANSGREADLLTLEVGVTL
jgi:hypothetical protein